MNCKVRGWERKTTHRHTCTDILQKSTTYTVLALGICRGWWTLTGKCLLITSTLDCMPPFALSFSTSAPKDSQDTGPFLKRRSCPVILDQHTQTWMFSAFQSERTCKNSSSDNGRSTWETDFLSCTWQKIHGFKAKYKGTVHSD